MSFARMKKFAKAPLSNGVQPKSSANRERRLPSPLMGLQGQVLIFVIPAKAGIRRIEAKFAPPEIRYNRERQIHSPLIGRRLG